MKTRTKIQRAIKELPMLTDFGLGVPGSIKNRKKSFKQEQQRLLSSHERFEATCEWLQGVDKTLAINTKYTSYFLKHIVEQRIGGHVSNGVFIAAAIHCGFDYKHSKSYPNLFFNMSEDSIQEKYEECLLYGKYQNGHAVGGSLI